MLGVVLMAGCGGSSTHTSGSSGARASANATTVGGTSALVQSADGSFKTVIPSGFQDTIGAQRGGPVNVLYLATRPYIAVNALRTRAPANSTLDALAHRGVSSLAGSNPTNHGFSRIGAVSVGGSPGRAWSYLGESERGQPAVYAEVNVLHDGWLYAIGGTAPAGRFSVLQAALGQVIANWRWTGH